MRRFYLVIVVLMFLFFNETVVAENGCSTVLFYSSKEWIPHQNLFDGMFNKEDSHFINSQGIVVKQNVLGTVETLNRVDSAVFTPETSYSLTVGKNEQFPRLVSIGFGKVIKVGKIQFQIDAINTKTKRAVSKKIYINADPKYQQGAMIYNKNQLIQSTNKNGLITLDLKNQIVGSIEIIFELENDEIEYTMNSFQILDYQTFEHTGWVSDRIEGADTKEILICANQGEFKPNGTNSKWVQQATTLFSPSSKVISSYRPLIETRDVTYDIGKTDHIQPYSVPNIRNWMGGYTQQISHWKKRVVNSKAIYTSIGPSGQTFPFIETSVNRGVIYVARPYFWSSSRQTSYYDKSFDPYWCNDVTGTMRTPCYKRGGHTSNARLNLYDVEVISYRNVVNPSLRAVKSSVYTLINERTKKRVHLDRGGDEIKTLKLLHSGVWRIECEITDFANNKGIKNSSLFYIDNQKPTAYITPLSATMTKPFAIRIIPYDELSRVKKWSYSLSSNGGNTFDIHSGILKSTREFLQIRKSGLYVLKVYVEDNAGNTNIVISNPLVVEIDQAVIEQVLVPTYDVDQLNKIYVKVKCDSCEITPQVLKINVDDQDSIDTEITQQTKEIILDYIPRQSIQSKITVQLGSEKLELVSYEKSREFKETSENQLEFSGVVVSGIKANGQQHNFVETLSIQYQQDQEQYFSGQGIESRLPFTYTNECVRIENFACVVGDEAYLKGGEVKILYQDSAEDIKNEFVSNDGYLIHLDYDQMNKAFVLPEFYLDRKSGKVHSKQVDESIAGGRKWYTHPLAKLQEYPIVVTGNQFGVNEFSWRSHHRYSLYAHYYDTYQLRFVERKNPFPNRESALWDQNKAWFNQIDEEKSMYQETFK